MENKEENIHEGCELDIQALKDENESLQEQIDGLEEIISEIKGLVS